MKATSFLNFQSVTSLPKKLYNLTARPQSGRDISMASTPQDTPKAAADSDKKRSPFFDKLPRELRDKVYKLAYAPESDIFSVITMEQAANRERRTRRSSTLVRLLYFASTRQD